MWTALSLLLLTSEMPNKKKLSKDKKNEKLTARY